MQNIQTYSPQSLENITKSNFLNESDLDFIKAKAAELQDTFEKKQIWRTETEIKVSVLNDISFPTPASKYWQSIREQAVFYDNLIDLSFDYRKNEVNIKKTQREVAILTTQFEYDDLIDLDLEMKQIELEELLFRRANMELAAKDRVREIKIWSQIKEDLIEKDPTFDTQNVNTHQLVSYGQQFLLELEVLKKTSNPSFGEVQSALGKLQSTLKYGLENGLLLEMMKPLNNPVLKAEICNMLLQIYPELINQITEVADALQLIKNQPPITLQSIN